MPTSNTNNTDINDMTPDSAVRMVPTYGSESWSGFMQREERMVSTSQSHSHSPYLSGLISSLEDSIDSGDTASATYLNDCNRRNVGEKNLGGVAFNPKKIIDVEGRHRAKTDSAVRTNLSNGKILRVLGLNRVGNGVEERGPITQGRTLDLCPSQIPSQGVLSRSRSADKSVTWCQEGESVSKNIGTRSASAGREIHESQSFLPINAMKSNNEVLSTRSHNDIPKTSNARSISLPSYNWKDVSQFDSSSPHSVTGLLPYDEIPVSTGESSTYDTGHPETDVDFLAVKYTSTPPDCDVRTADCDVSTDLVSELQLRYSSVVADDIRGVWLWENDVRILNGICQVETDILNTETISSLQIAPLTILLTDNDMNEFSSLKCNASVRSDSEIERGRETGVSRWKGRWRNVSSSALKISKFFNKKG